MSVDQRQFAPATARNREFILPILQRVLPATGAVLEIGSGTGEHAVYFAQHLPNLNWQPSELSSEALPSINAWIKHSGATNIAPPVVLDLNSTPWPVPRADTLICINVIHYSPWASTQALFAGAANLLPSAGVIYCYGAYKRNGYHTAPSNEAFDVWLKNRNPNFGVRDLEAIEEIAVAQGFRLDEVTPMPSNNFSLIFRRV